MNASLHPTIRKKREKIVIHFPWDYFVAASILSINPRLFDLGEYVLLLFLRFFPFLRRKKLFRNRLSRRRNTSNPVYLHTSTQCKRRESKRKHTRGNDENENEKRTGAFVTFHIFQQTILINLYYVIRRRKWKYVRESVLSLYLFLSRVRVRSLHDGFSRQAVCKQNQEKMRSETESARSSYDEMGLASQNRCSSKLFAIRHYKICYFFFLSLTEFFRFLSNIRSVHLFFVGIVVIVIRNNQTTSVSLNAIYLKQCTLYMCSTQFSIEIIKIRCRFSKTVIYCCTVCALFAITFFARFLYLLLSSFVVRSSRYKLSLSDDDALHNDKNSMYMLSEIKNVWNWREQAGSLEEKLEITRECELYRYFLTQCLHNFDFSFSSFFAAFCLLSVFLLASFQFNGTFAFKRKYFFLSVSFSQPVAYSFSLFRSLIRCTYRFDRKRRH